jgi:hypothetical protein
MTSILTMTTRFPGDEIRIESADAFVFEYEKNIGIPLEYLKITNPPEIPPHLLILGNTTFSFNET